MNWLEGIAILTVAVLAIWAYYATGGDTED